MKWVALLLAFVALSGCARKNPFETRYTKYMENGEPDAFSPRLILSNDIVRDGYRLLEDGYLIMGESYYTGRRAHQNAPLQHGRNIGAEIVLFRTAVADSYTQMIPWHSTQTSQVQGAYGGNLGTITTRTMTPIPVQRTTYSNWATFWRKGPKPIFGGLVMPLPDEAKREAETNRGVYVFAIVKGSPAYKHDVVVGDVITEVNGSEIDGPDALWDALYPQEGKDVILSVIRKGKPKEIKLTLAMSE